MVVGRGPLGMHTKKTMQTTSMLHEHRTGEVHESATQHMQSSVTHLARALLALKRDKAETPAQHGMERHCS